MAIWCPLLLQAEASGLVQDGSSVIVACDQNASTNSEFSIVIRSPTDNEPTVVTRESNQTTTVKETLTKPAPEKTAIQKYQDMEESALDQAALEGLPSSSSSSNEGAPMPHGGQAEDANGQVIAGAITPEVMVMLLYMVRLCNLNMSFSGNLQDSLPSHQGVHRQDCQG